MSDYEFLSIDDIFDDEIGSIIQNIENEVDIITFCESPHFLNQELHPVERLVLKVFYGLNLDNTKRDI